MRPSPNSRLNGNKHYFFKAGRINVHEASSNHHSVLEGNTPPSGNKVMAYLPEIGLSPTQEEQPSSNLSLDKSSDEKQGKRGKADSLPKINNPKAEKRLKALMNLLGKKNPTIPKKRILSNRQESYAEVQDSSSAELKSEKSHLILPFLTPKPVDKKDVDNIHKKLQKVSRGKVIIKVKADQVAPKQSKTEDSEITEQRKERKQGRELSVPVDNKKRVIFKQYSHNTSEEKVPSPTSGDSTKDKDVNIWKKKNLRVRKFVELPQPSMDFDQRVHRVSIDEALDRLTQLTAQSSNARKDLLKVQESALAIKLRFERQSISLNKLNSEREAVRNQ